MKVLIAGANGYIGKQLLPVLIEKQGAEVVALVRSKTRLAISPHLTSRITVIEADFLDSETLKKIPDDIDVAYYLVHSMSQSIKNFESLEELAAQNFIRQMKKTSIKQIIYLTGLITGEKLSPHLKSRLNVENILRESEIPYSVLRAGIVIGSGSASFEIIRDLVEKLPVMIAPKWVKNLCQPISIEDVIYYLTGVLMNERCLDKVFDIGGPDKLSYQEMLLQYAEVRGLKRFIINVPILTPRLSSYWLYFVTSTNFSLAVSLVDSLKNDAICQDETIKDILPRKCLNYRESIESVFSVINQNTMVASWKDSMVLSELNPDLKRYIEVPYEGCLREKIVMTFKGDRQKIIDQIWSIGGDNGWYYMDWAWTVRGFIDKVFGGAGLNRGRTNQGVLKYGDSLDFWRVLLADKEKGHLLLYAEMKTPGEAWLEFNVSENTLTQTAHFRPKGVLGRLYWYGLFPIHHLIFRGMPQAILRRAGVSFS